jgi:hypothetical protein
VANAVTRLGVDYPVALDDDMTIWNAFANQYWPADYIYDRGGHQVSVHFGEGGYGETEDLLRKLLGLPASAPRAAVGAAQGGSASDAVKTRETYVGGARGADGFASPEPLIAGRGTFTRPASLATNEHALDGDWIVAAEYAEAASRGAAIVLRYVAGQVNLVMSTATGEAIDVSVQIDDRPPTTVTVHDSDMYVLVTDPHVGPHLLRLTATAPGLRAYAFTFGG